MASSSSITPSSMKKDRGDEEQDSSLSSITPFCMEKYDVYLNSRGEDTRHSFVRHLCDVLRENKISTFTYDSLQRGDWMGLGTLEAIEGSRISVIIFSKGYASSRWCLEELVKILDCRKKYNQIVIPVFYDIEPSQVRKQTGPFAAAFKNHGASFVDSVDKVIRWRIALKEASNLAGFVLSEFKSEAALTEVIVDDILKKLGKEFVKRWSIGDILKRYKVHKDEKALYVDIVNFLKPYCSGHKDEEELHYDIVNLIKRCSEDKDEEAIHDPKITAEWFQRITAEKMFVAICFILELPSVVFDKLSSEHKPQYVLASMVMSFLTMLICIIQLVHQCQKRRVGWKQKAKILWPDLVGLFCVILQSIFIAIDYRLHLRNINDPIAISIWPIIFSFFTMFSTFFKEFPEKEASTKSTCSTRASAVLRLNIV